MRTIYVILDWPDLQKKQLVEFFDLLCETALVNLVDQFRVHSAPPEAARRSPPKLHLNLAEGGRIARKISQNMRRPCGRRDCLSSWDRRLPAARGLLTTAESAAELPSHTRFRCGSLAEIRAIADAVPNFRSLSVTDRATSQLSQPFKVSVALSDQPINVRL